jgi:bleomycin hydrolase
MTISLPSQKIFIVKKLTLLSACAFFAASLSAQTFTVVKDNAHGNVEDQCQTGTCWSFATSSFIESEIIRKGNKPVDVSEMYNVRVTYPKKADSFVRFQGKQQFGPGGLSHDVLNTINEFGIVPEANFDGMKNSSGKYNHNSLDAALSSFVQKVLDDKLVEQSTDWKHTVDVLLDAEIGKVPETFTYEGKSYTPASFRDMLKINANEYVCLTSFSHHPFYSTFVLEVPDNWSKKAYYNLPLDEFQQVADNAIANGFTIAWDADVSEKTFDFMKGYAYVKELQNEPSISQERRQEAFDRFQTTDDHLMHITGSAKDEKGNAYYIVKNSWGSGNPYNGYQYVSVPYFRYKTVCMVVHKDALPKEVAKKLGI